MADLVESNQSGMRIPIVAIALLVLGFVLLLNTTGVVSWGIWLHLFRFWPLILIAVGLNIILSPRFPVTSAIVVALVLAAGIGAAAYLSNQTAEGYDYQPGYKSAHSSNLADIHTLDMNIGFGAGSLAIDSDMSGFQDDMFFVRSTGIDFAVDETRNEGVSDVAISLDNPETLRSEDDGGWEVNLDLFDLFHSLGDIDWDVGISPDVAVSLDIDAGAADVDLDLAHVNLDTLNLDIGAADVDVTLPVESGHTDVYLNAAAADIDIGVPHGVAALIESDSALTSLDVDTSRFPGNDGVYQSSDYATAQNRVHIRIDAGISDISIN